MFFLLFAVMVHCSRRGTEAIVGDLSHTFLYEQGKGGIVVVVLCFSFPFRNIYSMYFYSIVKFAITTIRIIVQHQRWSGAWIYTLAENRNHNWKWWRMFLFRFSYNLCLDSRFVLPLSFSSTTRRSLVCFLYIHRELNRYVPKTLLLLLLRCHIPQILIIKSEKHAFFMEI